jgi:outer membrane receptor protein involved in Fe transport
MHKTTKHAAATGAFRKTLLTAAVLAALAVMGVTPVRAQQTAAVADQAANQAAGQAGAIQQVDVRGVANAYDPRRDDTAAKIVVNHDEIVKYGDTSVLDVLKRVPGVTVSGAGGRGSEVQMRGLGGGYTQILLNGERTPPGFTLDSLAPDVIERIEVLRAASAEFSTESIAGTINIVLKKSVKAGERMLKTGFSRSRESLGPNADLQLSDKAGKLAWSIAADYAHEHYTRTVISEEEFDDAAGVPYGLRLARQPENGRYSHYNLTPRLVWTFENGDTLTSQTFVNVGRFENDNRTLVDTPLGAPPAYPDLHQTVSNDFKTLREEGNWVHKFESGAALDAKVSGNVGAASNATYRAANLDAPPNPALPALPTLRELVQSNASFGGFNTKGKYTSASWEGHALAFGWDGGHDDEHDARRDRDSFTPGVALPGGDEIYRADITRVALYGQDEWEVTPRWSMYAGVRWEGIRTRIEGNTFATVHNFSSVWSPLFQTLYKLPDTKGDQVRLALTRTYKAPDLQSLIPHRFTSVNNDQTQPDHTGNPDQKPELALGIDAAYEHYWAEGALLSAAVSARDIDNNTREQTVFDGSRWVARPVNTGHARARSVELEAKFPLKAIVATTTALDLRASLSRNWSSVDNVPGPHNRLLDQTPMSATLGADYKLGAFSGGGSFVFKSGGEVQVSAYQATYQSARRDLALYALWKVDAKRQLRLAASNVLGQDWINASIYTAPGQGTQRGRTVYPSSATLRATLESKF